MADGRDEVAVVPVDAVVLLLGVLDNGGFVPVAESLAVLVFLESGVEVAACFPDVHFTAFTGNAVNTWLLVDWVPVLV